MGCYEDIGELRNVRWNEDNLSLSLFCYKPGRSGQTDRATQFILDFKNFSPNCLSTALRQVHHVLQEYVEQWRRDFDCRYVIPVPGHAAGDVPRSSQLVCDFLSSVFPWLQYPERLLFRQTSVPPAHMARPWERPTAQEHFESLGCSEADLAGAGVILFDDIRTSGNTSLACKWRLQQGTGCGDVVRIFLGRTGL